MTEQKTSTKAELFSSMFQFQAGIFKNSLEEVTEELALKRPSDRSNHTNWLLGHLLHCRYMLTNMLGVKADNPFGEMYWNSIEDKDYPSIDEVVTHFSKVSEMMIDRLSLMTDEELAAKPTSDKPSMDDIISFFIYHEAYHLGQIGYVRKMIGLEALKSH